MVAPSRPALFSHHATPRQQLPSHSAHPLNRISLRASSVPLPDSVVNPPLRPTIPP